MTFQPIAIVGQGCVLPDALTPGALWENVVAGKSAIRPVPEGRWRMATEIATDPARQERCATTAGGYVTGFDEVWDPAGFRVPARELAGIDPLFHWVLHASRAALVDAGLALGAKRGGLVLGNLSFPTEAMTARAEAWFRGAPRAGDARDRFMSGLPAHLAASALGFGAGAFCLDAACASSLYAIRIACDWLHSGRADLMLAGAVNRADNLFLHAGFTALTALSPSGRSRPFHREADGLIPAEGAGVVALLRLDDAVRDGRKILGVIRGVGLSNDGRARNLLAPSSEGQVRAMQSAYAMSGIDPRAVSLVECHATGTQAGDAVELQSMRAVFPSDGTVTVGSLKSNLGHLITAAGVAGLHKVLGAMAYRELPPTLDAADPIDGLEGFRALGAPERWSHDEGAPRRAAVSAFGFGGNNAHLLIEERTDVASRQTQALPPEPLAVVGMGLRVGAIDSPRALQLALKGQRPIEDADTVEVALEGLRFPPNDLKAALPQQLLVLEAARDALGPVTIDPARTGVLVGMGCDVDVTTPGIRWRNSDAVGAPVRAAEVLGQMPNIVANRINLQLDLRGLGLTTSAEELSGVAALDTAGRWLRDGTLDAAVVGAVDVCRDPRHSEAAAALKPGAAARDAAVVFVVKTLARARQSGDPILGIVDEVTLKSAHPGGERSVNAVLGDAHAAQGLLEVAAALLIGHGQDRKARVVTPGIGEVEATVKLRTTNASLPERGPRGASFSIPMLRGLEPVIQAMPPAPHLPSTTSTPEAPVPEREPRTPAPPSVNEILPQVSSRIEVTDPRASAWADHLTDLNRAHQAYLSSVSHAHRVFLEQRGAPAPAPAVVEEEPVAVPDSPRGPTPLWDRAALEHLASHNISDIFGPLFKRQDDFPRQVRMPEPPLLLCDRVMSIDAEPGVLTPHTTIRTESDVTAGAWYLHDDRIPAGILIEAGQADLLLISYMGVDFENRGERVYRLLGCDLSYHGALPPVGSLLHYDIHVDGFATHGETRIFFFHSDCRLGGPEGEIVLSVRNGQAGFFTDEELDQSGGVLWSPEDVVLEGAAPVAAPVVVTEKRSLDRAALEAWSEGDLFACFGPGFELAQTHVHTPRIQGGAMLLVDRVTELDPAGGPLGRGYLRAELDLHSDAWFQQGHFKDDPCMPGTLMFEGCLQTLSIYLAGLGFTLDKDAWRFEPSDDEVFKLRCRGQATPDARHMVYEVFVRDLVGGDAPKLVADILATVDGRKALICHEVSLSLVVDYPLSRHPTLTGRDAVAPGTEPALLATAWGAPSSAFGELYAHFDGPGRHARLPGPPYHFMSRVRSVDAPIGEMQAGGTAVVEYDVPEDAWFFDDEGHMPFAVLLEVALQPCGWLSSYVGSMNRGEDLYYRNLDGNARVHRTLGPNAGTLTTRTKLTQVSESGGMIIHRFALALRDAQGPVFTGETTFGFFPPAALANQVGLRADDAARAQLHEAGRSAIPEVAGPKMQMIDRIEAYLPKGGSAGLGYARAQKTVDPAEWFFKAHFFEDPVQPGSLGVEAMLQTLKWMATERGLGERFEPIAAGEPVTWTYRGQVTPKNTTIQIEVDVLAVEGDLIRAQSWLWVDGLRIYHAPALALRAR